MTSRDDRYWAAIARDHAAGEVDAVTRLADAEVEAVEARVDALLDELATVRDTLEKRTAAHGRLAATVDRVRALGDDWARGRAPTAAIELRRALDPEVTP